MHNDYIESMRVAQADDPNRRYLVYGLSFTFAVLTQAVAAAYCRHVYSPTAGGSPSDTEVERVVSAYERFRVALQRSYRGYAWDLRPMITNWLPESSFRAFSDPGCLAFGDVPARIEMCGRLEALMEKDKDGYKLLVVDDFAVNCHARLVRLIGGAETVVLVGEPKQRPAADDFRCGAMVSRRSRDFRLRWSQTRDAVDRAIELFRHLDALNPRRVEREEIAAVRSSLEKPARRSGRSAPKKA